MTRFSFKRTAVAGALALTTLGATLGVAGAQALPAGTTDSTVYQQQPGSPGQPGRPGRGAGNGEQRPQLTEEQRQQFEQQRAEAQQRYIDALAKHLGMDSSTVKAALEQTAKDMQAARISEIQQAVTDGKLTQEQADAMIQHIQQGGPGFGMGGPGMGGPGMGGPGRHGPGAGGPQGGR